MSPPAAPAPAHGHPTSHAHGHGLGHVHAHGPVHSHAHDHGHPPPPSAASRLQPSLLMAGVGARLLAVLGLLALLWAAVAWALGDPA